MVTCTERVEGAVSAAVLDCSRGNSVKTLNPTKIHKIALFTLFVLFMFFTADLAAVLLASLRVGCTPRPRTPRTAGRPLCDCATVVCVWWCT